jgi:3-dehydroquinate synthase
MVRNGLKETYADTVISQKFSVSMNYAVYFTHNVFNQTNRSLVNAIACRETDRRHRVFSIIDKGLSSAHRDISEKLRMYFKNQSDQLHLVAPAMIVEGGERSKEDHGLPVRIQRSLDRFHMDRQSVVLIFGGGAVLDMAGFAAATTHRGVRTVRVPTTLLSQADGGLGVKTGINCFGVKNFLGTFTPPFAVINDFSFLRTLRPRYLVSGMAEAVKVALVRDVGFFEWLEVNSGLLRKCEAGSLAKLVRRSAEIHLHHIATSGDAFECGSARPLDFGHWAAHKLETLSAYKLHHGEAVAIGIAIDSQYSTDIGLLNEPELQRILHLLDELGLPSWHPLLDMKEPAGHLKVLRGLEEFQEHIGGNLTITLLEQIGKGIEVVHVDHAMMRRTLSRLKKRYQSRCGLT